MRAQEREPPPAAFLRLTTFRQVGLGGLLDCSGSYFIINISAILIAASFLFIFVIILNYDASFDPDRWGGVYNGTLTCETPKGDSEFVQQPIAATSCYVYVLAAVLCGQLGLYDILSWRERTKIWRETHLNPDRFRRNSRTSIRSHETLGSLTTVSAEHEALSYRRRYNEYVMGKRGNPSLAVRQPIWSLLFGVTLSFLGVTGFLFHASLTNLAKRLDVFALWCLVVHLIAYSWTRFFSDGIKWKFLCFDFSRYQNNPRRSSYFSTLVFLTIAGIADFGLFLYLELLEQTEYDVAVLLSGFLLFVTPMFLHWFNMGKKIDSSWSLLVLSLSFMLISYLLNEYDQPGEQLCNPGGISSHAAWHGLSAVGVFLLFLFFRSDVYIKDVPIDELNSPRLSISNPAALGFVNQRLSLTREPTGDDEEMGLAPSNLGPAEEVDEDMAIASSALSARRKKKKKRPSAIRGTIPQLSAENQEALDDSISMKRRLMNQGPDADIQVEVEQMWTCSRCNNTENSISMEACTRCGNPRPNLDNMVVIPFAAPHTIPMAARSQISRADSRRSNRSSTSKRSNNSKRSSTSKRTAQSTAQRNSRGVPANPRASNRSLTQPRASNPRSVTSNTRTAPRASNPRSSNARTQPRNSNTRATNPRSSNARTQPRNSSARAANPRSSNSRTQPRNPATRQSIPQAVPVTESRESQRRSQNRTQQRTQNRKRRSQNRAPPRNIQDDEDPPI